MIGTALIGFLLGALTSDWEHVPAPVPWTIAALSLGLPFTATT